MKKVLYFFAAIATVLSFCSCEDDAIAMRLDGIWEGEVAQEVWTYRGYSTTVQRVDIEFYRDPYAYGQGDGMEYDYVPVYDYHGYVRGYDVIEVPFDFDVRNGVIYLHYLDGSEHDRIVIRNYHLDNGHFYGTFCSYYNGVALADFDFWKVYDYYSRSAGSRAGEGMEFNVVPASKYNKTIKTE